MRLLYGQAIGRLSFGAESLVTDLVLAVLNVVIWQRRPDVVTHYSVDRIPRAAIPARSSGTSPARHTLRT